MQYFGFDRPSFAFKTYGFGANPDAAILALFAGGKQGVWYDPSDKSTLFQDVAGTIPVTKDGDPVALMRDKSGNGNHATQTVSAARPIYKTDGILHWLAFDGVDDWLSFSGIAQHIDGINLQSALKSNAPISTTNSVIYLTELLSSGELGLYINDSVGNTVRLRSGASNINEAAPTQYPQELAQVVGFYTRVGEQVVYRNGGVIGTGEADYIVSGLKSALFKKISGATVYGMADFYGLIISTDMKTSDAATVTYLATKAGVVL